MKGRVIGTATLLVLVFVLLLSASIPKTPTAQPAPTVRTAAAPSGAYFDHVVIVLMENHAICDVLTYCGGRGAYETLLANGSGLATSYVSCGTSLLNYLCLTGASTFGCDGNYDPNSNNCTALAWHSPNIVDRLIGANLTWKAYLENMTSNCLGVNDNGYVVRHDPFVYYGDIVTNETRCNQVVPAGANDNALLNDLSDPAAAPNYMWLTPNICNDMDKCPLDTGDAYLSRLVPQILGSPAFTTDRSALFIAFDEPSGGKGSPYMYTVWAGPLAKVGYTSDVPYGHYSLLSTLEANWGLAPLTANDSAAPNMSEFFVGPGPSFSLSAFPWSVAVQTGQNTTSTIQAEAYNGFNGKVDLSTNSSPAGMVATCSPGSIHHGGSSTCTMTAPSPGVYLVNITGTSGGLVANVTIEADVYDPLLPRFSFAPTDPFSGEVVNFTGRASGGTPPYNFTWDFGDGSTGMGARPLHVFAREGSYDVVLTLVDSIGLNVSVSHTVVVARAAPLASTAAAVGVGDTYATLQGTLESLGESGTVEVGFLVGTDPGLNGAVNESAGSKAASGAFNFTTSGLSASTTYSFEAWANGAGFATGGILSFATAAQTPAPLTASFSGSPTPAVVDETVTFVAAASGGVSPYSYAWQFGDGTTGSGGTVTHFYQATGTYSVSVTVSDSAGHSTTVIHSVVVAPPAIPTSSVTLAGTSGNAGWFTSDVVVTLTASDPRGLEVWVGYAIDHATWVNYSGPFTLHDGQHLLEFAASDAYGATPESEHTLNVSVDTLPPDLDLVAPTGAVTTSVLTVHWTGMDAGSGLEAYSVKTDDGAFLPVGMATSSTLALSDGTHTVTVRAQDVAGNAITRSVTVQVDTNPFSLRNIFGGPLFYAAILLVAVILAALVVLRRRKRKAGAPPQP